MERIDLVRFPPLMKNKTSVTRSLFAAVALLGSLTATMLGARPDENSKLLREGQASLRVFDPATLPPDVSPNLFGGEISGNTFELFAREIPAQTLTIELGFVDTQSKGAGQRTFSLSANGTPLDANLDVWSKAGGAFKPWVFKTAYQHAGGSLAIQFAGLDKPAFVSYARILDGAGKELAAGVANDWKKAERLTLLDSRSHPFRKVKVGEVPFFNVDHSPVGSWSSLIYGMEASGGVQVCKQPGGEGTLIPHEGIIIAAKNGAVGTGHAVHLEAIRSPGGRADRRQGSRPHPRRLHGCLDHPAGRELDALYPGLGHAGLADGFRRGETPFRPARHVHAVPRGQPRGQRGNAGALQLAASRATRARLGRIRRLRGRSRQLDCRENRGRRTCSPANRPKPLSAWMGPPPPFASTSRRARKKR